MSDSFIELVRQFVYDRFALEPVAATVAGVHQHDHELGDFTADGFARRRAFIEEWLARFEGVDEARSPAQYIDRELILSELRGERALFPFERWRRQPGLYSDVITRGAYYALLRAQAPVEERLAMPAERLSKAPAALDAARENLDPALVPAEWIAIAERTAPAGARFLRERIPQEIPDTALGRAVGRSITPAANAAAEALDRYAAWLTSDLRPRAKGSFAIGRDAYEALLKDKELLPYDSRTLSAFGEELISETEAKIAEAAKALGDDDWRDSVGRFRLDHPE